MIDLKFRTTNVSIFKPLFFSSNTSSLTSTIGSSASNPNLELIQIIPKREGFLLNFRTKKQLDLFRRTNLLPHTAFTQPIDINSG